MKVLVVGASGPVGGAAAAVGQSLVKAVKGGQTGRVFVLDA